MRTTLGCLFLGLALVACEGAEGPPGEDGDPGPAGEPGMDGSPGAPGMDGEDGMDGSPGTMGTPGSMGTPGADGLACWDVNANGLCDAAEDVNVDSACDALDCQGPAGPPGAPGPAGTSGIVGFGKGYSAATTTNTSETAYNFVAGTTLTVAAGDKVAVTATGQWWRPSGTSSVYVYMRACYRVGTGVPTVGNLMGYLGQSTPPSVSGKGHFTTQDIFSFAAGGTYQFGFCFRKELSIDPDVSVSYVQVNALVFE